jgi:CRISPR-associated protein Cmr6
MPIYATTEALGFWKPGHARSLAASHFVTLAGSKKDSSWRTQSCDSIRKGATLSSKSESFNSFASALAGQGASTLFAKLEARLILNAGDGVIENGGICLDRTSGIPFIPGSAIKAAARRCAIHQLGQTEVVEEKAKLLVQICLIFGFGGTEWKPGRKAKQDHPHGGHSHSDFWLAMVPLEKVGSESDAARDDLWTQVSERAACMIFASLSRSAISPEKSLAPQLPNLAGAICFLPAYPTTTARVETDVLTPHHTKYYNGDKEVATDDEDPVPIVFPAVARGTGYQFTLLPRTTNQDSGLLESATRWLGEALKFYGLGAKTNAGYGWFSIDTIAQEKAADERRAAIEEVAKVKRLAAMTPEERDREVLGELDHEEFVRVIKNLENEDASQQKIVCQMLLTSKKEDWKNWRKQKKGNWPSQIPLIRQIAKTHGIELN